MNMINIFNVNVSLMNDTTVQRTLKFVLFIIKENEIETISATVNPTGRLFIHEIVDWTNKGR